MKTAMKILILLFPFSVFAASGKVTLTAADQAEWKGKLQSACMIAMNVNQKALSQDKKEASCACVARNHLRLAMLEDRKGAIGQLTWVEKEYADQSTTVSNDDPYAISDLDLDFQTKCLQDSGYDFKPF